jgi:hypothetical protein
MAGIQSLRYVLVLLYLLVLVLLQLSRRVEAMTVIPTPFEEIQPDGTSLTLRWIGDESYHTLIYDVNGFAVVKEESTNWFMYANGDLEQTALKVGIDDPAAPKHGHLLLTKHTSKPTLYRRKCNDALKKCIGSEEDVAFHTSLHLQKISKMRMTAAIGTRPNLMVAMRFSDHVNRTLPSQADLQILMNHNGPHALCPTGSVRDVSKLLVFTKGFLIDSCSLDLICWMFPL